MNVGRIFIYLFTAILVMSCSGENDPIVRNHGYQLNYIHRPAESLIAYQNDYPPNTIDTAWADLQIFVTSALREQPGYTPQRYSIDGDKAIELQLANFLDPDNDKYTGDMPIPVEYRTEACKSIRITMYDKNGSFLSDITDQARFFYVNDPNDHSEVGQNIIINSEKKLLGKIKIGTTIKEYLSNNPLVFAEAHFIFDGIDKESFSNGNYTKVEIELSNGIILTSFSSTRGK
ncbi:MAG: hypothetical protein GX963_02530 [Bacteroidales bacterium]|nr:hypothetical protein [Bacteroidales bacterium]